MPIPINGSPSHRLPLWLKLAYTAFCAVMIPVYLANYGPTNFLYFCDVAVLMTLAAVWLESPLLASMPAVGILIPQALWIVDFICEAAGFHLTSMTGYMFDQKSSLFLRSLSFFHFWLPILLMWMVWRLGYDRRALPAWTVLAFALMLICYNFLPPQPAPADNPNLPVNVNYVFGMSEEAPQERMDPRLYLLMEMAILAVGIFLPTHWVLKKVCRPAAG